MARFGHLGPFHSLFEAITRSENERGKHMKRDWELCREILILTEEMPEEKHRLDVFASSELEGFTERQIGYHVHLLHEAGLLEAMEARTMNNPFLLFPRFLTMAGHDFLEATRNDSVWDKTLEFVKSKGGSVTLEIIKEIALGFLKNEYGIDA